MKPSGVIGLIALVWSISPYAQQPLVGKWEGTVVEGGRTDRATSIAVEITNADGGKLKGTMQLNPYRNRGCSGIYQIEGTYQDNKVEFKSNQRGGVDWCNMEYKLVAEGGQLKGTGGTGEVQLSKK
jgi:hypothetical protein